MADTTTTNKGYTKPELGTTGWGSKINTNLDSIDSDINDIETDKVNKVIGGTSGNLAGVDANGDLTDSGYVVVDQDDMAANSNTKVPTQQSVKAYVDDTVAATNEVVEDTTPQLGGDLDTNNSNINFGDNDKAQFGAGNDLQIYHSGSNSHITDAGTGNLIIRADDLRLQSNAGEEYLSADSNGALALRYDNSTKLATTSTGIDVTGSVTCDGFTSTGIDDNATSTAITIDASKNVGIGVVPESWGTYQTALQVGPSGTIANYSSGSNTQTHLTCNAYDLTSPKYLVNSAAASMRMTNGACDFRVAPSGTADTAISFTTAMTINNGGNVRINNTDAGNYRLKIKYSGGGEEGIGLQTTFNGGGNMLRFVNYLNTVVGGVYSSNTSTSYSTSSDYRLKENVVPMTGSIDRLKELKPSRFNFIADADKTVDGFLAHEAQEVVPEAVHGTKDAMMDEEYEVTPAVMDGETVVTEAVMGTRSVPDYQGIDQSKLVPLLVASLQEAIARIEVLENA